MMKPVLRSTMNRIRKFTNFSVRDLIASAAPTILVIAGICLAAYLIVDPAPPRKVVLGTGQDNRAATARSR